MNIKEAQAVVLEAASIRRDQWNAAAGGEWPVDIVPELVEADCKECIEMAERLGEALALMAEVTGAPPYEGDRHKEPSESDMLDEEQARRSRGF